MSSRGAAREAILLVIAQLTFVNDVLCAHLLQASRCAWHFPISSSNPPDATVWMSQEKKTAWTSAPLGIVAPPTQHALGGRAWNGWSALPGSQPLWGLHLACLISRLLLRWVLLPEMPFFSLCFLFGNYRRREIAKIAQGSPVHPASPDGDFLCNQSK